MSKVLDKSYRLVPCCMRCKNVFRRDEYDELPTFFCTHNAPPRPRCDSHFEGEGFNTSIPEILEKQKRDWKEWRSGREVEPFGLCDRFALMP